MHPRIGFKAKAIGLHIMANLRIKHEQELAGKSKHPDQGWVTL
jgi:hypothetical protein